MTLLADRAEVLGCSIDRVDMSEAAERCDRFVRTRAGATTRPCTGSSTAVSSSRRMARRWYGRRACWATPFPRASPGSI